MESSFERPNKPEGDLRSQVLKYFEEHDPETFKTEFDTYEEALAKSNEINAEYGDISFVAEDRGKMAVKFRLHQLGEGFQEYTPPQENGEASDMRSAA